MKILFVCTANLCRSPLAHGICLALLEDYPILQPPIHIASAGTHAYRDSPPNQQSQAIAKQHHIDISTLRSQKLIIEDFQNYHHIIAMDQNNLRHMQEICPQQHTKKIKRLLGYAPETWQTDIPDPYGLGEHGFSKIYDLIHQGCLGLLSEVSPQPANKS